MVIWRMCRSCQAVELQLQPMCCCTLMTAFANAVAYPPPPLPPPPWKTKKISRLKRQSNEIFDLHFVSSFEPAWATDQWVKICLMLVKISLSYCFQTLVSKKLTPRNKILRGDWFCAVWFCGRSTLRSMIPRKIR